MSQLDIETWFPDLAVSGYRITSPITEDYNCFAWAVSEVNRRLDPQQLPNCDWPDDVPRTIELSTFVALFGKMGFKDESDTSLEAAYDKIAIYADAKGAPTHAARQLPTGKWTSKLGDAEDIEHDNLEGIQGNWYGKVAVVLRRPR